MSTYKGIFGKTIKHLSSDPDNTTYEGQIWYNTTEGKFKTVVASAAWSSSAPLITARYDTGGTGTQTANLVFGGSPPVTNKTEEYDGSGWSTGGTLGTSRSGNGGAGTQTAGLSSGGLASDGATYVGNTEEYDGTSWSEQNDLSTSRGYSFTGGIQTAAWIGGGRKGPPYSNTADTEEYDGTSWTAGGALGSGGYSSSSSGPLTAGWAAGGSPTPGSSGVLQLIQFYDGSSWTNGPNAPTAFQNATGSGIQTLCLSYGMQTPSSSPGVTSTYVYDGSSFSVSPATLATARRSAARAMGPSGTAAILAGGRNTPAQSLTEEYNFTANTITAAAWSAGGSMGTGRYQGNGQNVGTKNAGMYSGGQGSYPPTAPATTVSNVEEYDGSSWSEVNNLPSTRAMFGAVGTQTAAFIFCGYGKPGGGPNPAPGSPNLDTTFDYDGTNWTSGTGAPTAISYLTGAGTATAALSIGGNPASTTCNEYDGSSWTAGGSMTTGRHNSSAFGIQTAAIVAGGAPGSAVAEDVESYDGSSWTSVADLIQPKAQAGTAGTQTDGLIFLGNEPSPTTTLGWNGTSWFTQPSTSTARYGGSNGSTSTSSAYYAGGGGGPPTRQTTEEFTAESSAINIESVDNS